MVWGMSSATHACDLAHARFAVVDVETSGLSAKRHRVLQVAVVLADGNGHVLDSWASLVRPRRRWLFRLGPHRIHGLKRADLRKAPPAGEVFGQLAQRIRGATFTAHNARFDAGFLEKSAERFGVTLDLAPQLCTLRLSRKLDPEHAQSHRLADVSARYGITNGRPHDALEDALATAAVLPHLLRAHGVTGTDQLERFIWPRPAAAPNPVEPATVAPTYDS